MKDVSVMTGIIVSVITIVATGSGAAWLVTDKIENIRLEIKADINGFRAEIKADRKELRAEFKQDIKDSEARTDEKISLSDKIDQLHGVK